MTNNLQQLEELFKREELVAHPLVYDNPKRKNKVLGMFIQDYADMTGAQVNIHKWGLLENLKHSLEVLSDLKAEGRTYSDRVLIGVENASRLALMPLLYPIIGGGNSMNVNGDNIDIALPKWPGLYSKIVNAYSHEMLHAYHSLMARDLKKAEIIDFDGFYELPCESLTPYNFLTPTRRQLKKFERNVLNSMIKRAKAIDTGSKNDN